MKKFLVIYLKYTGNIFSCYTVDAMDIPEAFNKVAVMADVREIVQITLVGA